MAAPKERIDKLLLDRGLVPSRERARALIMAGSVLVGDTPVTKAGALFRSDVEIRLRGQDLEWVSRGGLKLEGALDDFGVSPAGLVILDIGASTGGFTDVCLSRGALRSYAVDVGTNQLDYRLRTDPRVLCLEQCNARTLEPSMLPSLADFAVIDVSFISITKLLEAVSRCLAPDARVLAMVKPQFEVGPARVGKGGVVRDDAVRQEAVDAVVAHAISLGWTCLGQTDSRVAGPKGNREIFVHLARGGCVPQGETC
jgi:23S rRNA (cytidine1920-2'-O)/16S rRNA (cytidine1409-2'-O)-methyltransferase